MLQALGLTKSWEQKFLDWVDDLTEYTPDSAQICRQNFFNLFVFDTMMQRRKDHNQLNGSSIFRAKAFTVGDNYTLFKNDLGDKSHLIGFEEEKKEDGHPTCVQNLHGGMRTSPPATLRGEIFSVHSHRIYDLDRRFENGYAFIRKRIQLLVPARHRIQYKQYFQQDGKWNYEWLNIDSDTLVECWAYLGRKEYWEKLIDGGYQYKAVRVFKPNTNTTSFKAGTFPYYFYTGNE